MGMPSGMELFIIVGAIVLLFGGKKIPELAKGLGQGIKNFKKAVKDDDETDAQNIEQDSDVQTADIKTTKKEETKV
ncbi:MAG: twin-arginine translocase TatA/TatE family subunit [Epsilonproteobacteria bacterium]|nr:MAG: twin-arginine translocase TatA/TatE family subunit [Campylobacterota bacterium]